MELLIVTEKETSNTIAKRLAFAHELGHKDVLLLFQKHSERNQELVKKEKGSITGILITHQNQANALKKHYDAIVAPCKREFFENKNVDYILEPEKQSRQDFIHHRNSGLNQVLLNLCKPTTKRKAKGIITTASLLLHARRPSEILGRMMQNAKWCKKYDVAYHVTSGATEHPGQRDKNCLDSLKRTLV